MRVYVAGPMTGLPQLNIAAFHAAARMLRADGHTAVNPAEINTDPCASWIECMRADIRELVTCEAIYLLPGWERSRGATLEHAIAQALGFHVICAPNGWPMAAEPGFVRPITAIGKTSSGNVWRFRQGELPPHENSVRRL